VIQRFTNPKRRRAWELIVVWFSVLTALLQYQLQQFLHHWDVVVKLRHMRSGNCSA
jgi:hypothetical protein